LHHLLVPRVKGFAATVTGLRSSLESVLDVTICWNKPPGETGAAVALFALGSQVLLFRILAVLLLGLCTFAPRPRFHLMHPQGGPRVVHVHLAEFPVSVLPQTQEELQQVCTLWRPWKALTTPCSGCTGGGRPKIVSLTVSRLVKHVIACIPFLSSVIASDFNVIQNATTKRTGRFEGEQTVAVSLPHKLCDQRILIWELIVGTNVFVIDCCIDALID
jgi:hypothetical protein